MPHENLWEPHGLVKRFHGFVSGAEFVDSVREVAADPRFDDVRYIISDFRDVSGHSIDAAALEEIAVTRIGSMHTNPNVRVLLVAHDERALALVRATRAPPLDDTYETLAFPSMEAARAWLTGHPRQDRLPDRE